ncbi:TlpA family protein disulfide reductase [Sphingobacterium sp. SG20118]|uniref:TlpA family protein disulfide reductase n=1 Tax=Sphingobacterium sp. SG20118 TaxID=3367156 RepID=UPI0037DFC161
MFEGTMNEVLGRADGAEKLAIIEAQHDSLYQEKLHYIEANKGGLTDQEYRILKYDALGTRQHILLRTISILAATLGVKDSLLKAHYIAHFQQLYRDFEPDTVDSEIKAYAQNFAEYQFDVIHLRHALNRGGGGSFLFGNEREVYHYIRNHYSGLLRDKLLVMTVQRYRTMDSDYVLLKEACQDVEDDYFNRLVCFSLYRGGIGAKMPGFELMDTAGVIQTFVPEKGKVTLIDFWYTGCGACALIADKLHTYLDSMQHVPEFQMVSISIDKDKKVWKKSIQSGKYTHPSELNFYTKGLGSRHPMTMHFDIIGYPRFLLIDREGKILSSYVYPTLQNISELVNKALRGI